MERLRGRGGATQRGPRFELDIAIKELALVRAKVSALPERVLLDVLAHLDLIERTVRVLGPQ